MDYSGTDLVHLEPVAAIEMKEGQRTAQTNDLKLTYVRLEVNGSPGQVSDGSGLKVRIYPAGRHDLSFSDAFDQNPADLLVRADMRYDVVLESGSKSAEFKVQTLIKGRRYARIEGQPVGFPIVVACPARGFGGRLTEVNKTASACLKA